jgi:hypothetical protein
MNSNFSTFKVKPSLSMVKYDTDFSAHITEKATVQQSHTAI